MGSPILWLSNPTWRDGNRGLFSLSLFSFHPAGFSRRSSLLCFLFFDSPCANSGSGFSRCSGKKMAAGSRSLSLANPNADGDQANCSVVRGQKPQSAQLAVRLNSGSRACWIDGPVSHGTSLPLGSRPRLVIALRSKRIEICTRLKTLAGWLGLAHHDTSRRNFRQFWLIGADAGEV